MLNGINWVVGATTEILPYQCCRRFKAFCSCAWNPSSPNLSYFIASVSALWACNKTNLIKSCCVWHGACCVGICGVVVKTVKLALQGKEITDCLLVWASKSITLIQNKSSQKHQAWLQWKEDICGLQSMLSIALHALLDDTLRTSKFQSPKPQLNKEKMSQIAVKGTEFAFPGRYFGQIRRHWHWQYTEAPGTGKSVCWLSHQFGLVWHISTTGWTAIIIYLLACPNGKGPQGRPRICWWDSIPEVTRLNCEF